MTTILPGDILLYGKHSGPITHLIDWGEIIEDGKQSKEFYHVAIALNEYTKIEADGKNVAIKPIDYGNFDIYRPPIKKDNINKGLNATRKLIGQPYDWPLIIDDALRYLTKGHVHLPTKWINSLERHMKICSSVAAFYFKYTGWYQSKNWHPSPEDIYLMVKKWPVND